MKETYLGTRLGDCTQVVDHVGFGEANTSITDGEDLVLLVGDDADNEFLFCVENRRIGEGCISDFVERIRGVGDQLAKENLLVGVEGVYRRR